MNLFEQILLKKILRVSAIDFRPEHNINIDAVNNILKRKQYVQTIYGWKNDFVQVIVTKNFVGIKHSIPKNKVTIVERPEKELIEWLNYFERL